MRQPYSSRSAFGTPKIAELGQVGTELTLFVESRVLNSANNDQTYQTEVRHVLMSQ